MTVKGLKFDMRIYVLVASCKPLRIYIYREGLVRLATKKYSKVNKENKNDLFQHLTNYAVNKENANFVHEADERRGIESHKQCLRKFFRKLKLGGISTKKIWNGIKKICTKTVIAINPILKHNYTSCQSDDPYSQMCFELLGFDIMLDSSHKPYLLEVNHSPSFRTESKVDMLVKGNLIYDTLNMMNINMKERKRLISMKASNLKKRTLTGQRVKISDVNNREVCIKERDNFMTENCGDYECIFPSTIHGDEEPYEMFLREADVIYNKFTGSEAFRGENITRIEKLVSKNKISRDISKLSRIERIYGSSKKNNKITTKLPKTVSHSGKRSSLRNKKKDEYPIVETNGLGRVTSTDFGFTFKKAEKPFVTKKSVQRITRYSSPVTNKKDYKIYTAKAFYKKGRSNSKNIPGNRIKTFTSFDHKPAIKKFGVMRSQINN